MGCTGSISQICDAQTLCKVLFERYSSGYPIRVVKLTGTDVPATWLVLLAGTEFNILSQSNRLPFQQKYMKLKTFNS